MYLGLDLGTSGLKGLIVGEDQKLIAEATAPLSVHRPQDRWSEQDPADWIKAAEAVMDALGAQTNLSAIRGIGLSGQMHGATMLDAADEPLWRCILWNDTRSGAQASAMDSEPVWREVSGNIVFPGFTAPKVQWMREEHADIYDKIATVLLPKDFLRLWLTGERVSEMSDAAGTSWLDTGARDWSDKLLGLSGLSRDAMPRLIEGTEVSGTLRPELASRWGMSQTVPVAGGAGDNAASAVGMGVVAPGRAFVSLGTSGVLFAACDGFNPEPDTAVHTFCHALPNTWHQMGVILAATDALNWWASLVGSDAASLTAKFGALETPGGVVFLPYLGGERTPLNNADVRGAFVGLEHATDQNAGTRAVLDGVAFALADCRDALQKAGTQFDRCIAVGGGSQSAYWLQVVATVLDIPLDIPIGGDFGAAFGAARLGMMAATGRTDIAAPPPIRHTVEPVVSMTQTYKDAHARYRQAARKMMELS